MRPTPHLPSGGGPHRKHPMLRPASKAALAAAQPPAAAERPRIRLSEREPAPAPIEEPEVADPDQGVIHTFSPAPAPRRGRVHCS